MEILRRLADPVGSFDPETLRRARGYDGAVSAIDLAELRPDRVVASAMVRGTEPFPYAVEVAAGLHDDRLSVVSDCTCPVRSSCKHGAALCRVLGRTFAPGPQAAREPDTAVSALEELLADLGDLAPPEQARPGVALQVALGPARSRSWGGTPEADVDRVQLRPLRPGARQAWVRTGMGWSDVPVALRAQTHDLAQLRALETLRRALFPDHWYPSVEPRLTELGPRAADLLEAVRDAGVTFVAAPPLVSVEVAREPLRLVVDAGAGADRRTRLQVGLRHDDRLWRGSEVSTLGDPAGAAVLLAEGRLVVGRLDPPLPAGPVRALRRRRPVEVTGPADPVLRRLGGLVEVASDDGSVVVPEPLLPVLRVTVAWLSGSEAEVSWAWVYGDHPPFALTGPGPGPAGEQVARDLVAEREVLARLDPRPVADVALVAGVDALGLALLEVPAWRDVEGVEVVERDRPDFRESAADPQVDFVVPDAEAGGGTDGEGDGDGVRADGSTDWLDLDVVLTVEGERLALPQLLAALTRGDEHVVLPSGLYVRCDHPALVRLARTVHDAAGLSEGREVPLEESETGRIRVATDDLGTWAELSDTGRVDAAAAAWVARARALRDLVDLPEPDPVGLVSTLRPYQLDGLRWLTLLWTHDLGGVLADDMGLGKTLQVLALVAHARARRPDDPPFLVVAPTSVVGAWAGEAARHVPGLRVATVVAASGRRRPALADVAAQADVVVTSYALVRLGAAAYAELPWSGLVLDEAQQVKNHRSKAYAAVRGVRAPFRLVVTGTPFENRLLELWSLLGIAAPGLYPHERSFVERVVTPVEKQGDTAALQRFTRRIAPFLLRRTKDLVAADLPAKQEQVLAVTLSPRHRAVYDAHLARERQRILGLVDDIDHHRVAVLASLTRLRQLALDPALVDPEHDRVGSAKIDTLVDHLREVAAEGHRALVFSQFTGFLGRVRERLAAEGIGASYLDGSTRDRPAVVEGFRGGHDPVFLISLKAGGVGLTLTEADYVFVLDPWWNPAAEAQAVDRAHRIGQHRTVMVYRLVSTDTIEEKVMALKSRKAALFAQVLDGSAGLADAITADDIRDLFD